MDASEAIKEKVNKRACDALGKGDSVVVIENVLDCDSIAKARSSMLKMLEERCLSRVAHGQSSAVRDDKVAFVPTAFLQRDMQLNLGDVYDGFDDEEEEDYEDGSAMKCPLDLELPFRALASIASQVGKMLNTELLVPPQSMLSFYGKKWKVCSSSRQR